MTLVLPQENVLDIQNKCMLLIASPKTTIMGLTKLLGKLSFTTQAVLPGRIQCKYLQQQQVQAVIETNSYQTKIKLSQHLLAQLKWWKENLLFQNGKPLKIAIPQFIIQTYASKKGWGAVCQGTTTGGTWSYQERTKHINLLELIAVKFAILTFTRGKSVTTVHLQIGNMTALPCFLKMGGGGGVGGGGWIHSQELLQVAMEIWDYLLANRIAVIAEYLPNSLKIQANRQSRNHKDSSNWKLNPKSCRPRQLCSRFPSALLEKPLWVCIPSILLNREGTWQSKEGPVYSSYHNTTMANSALVRSIILNVGPTSHNSTQSDHIVTRLSVAKAPFAGRQPTTLGGMEGFSKALESEEISKLAATLISNSRRSGSISNYQSAWRKWASWCYER